MERIDKFMAMPWFLQLIIVLALARIAFLLWRIASGRSAERFSFLMGAYSPPSFFRSGDLNDSGYVGGTDPTFINKYPIEKKIILTCQRVWEDDNLRLAFMRVGLKGMFTEDEYNGLNSVYGGFKYLGKIKDDDLAIFEGVLRHVAAGKFKSYKSREAKEFIAKHLLKKNTDRSAAPCERVTVDEVSELIKYASKTEIAKNSYKYMSKAKGREWGDAHHAYSKQIMRCATRLRNRDSAIKKRGYHVAQGYISLILEDKMTEGDLLLDETRNAIAARISEVTDDMLSQERDLKNY